MAEWQEWRLCIKNYYKKRFDRHISATQLSRAQRDLDIMERIASGEWITRRMQQILAEKQRELQASKKTEIVNNCPLEVLAQSGT